MTQVPDLHFESESEEVDIVEPVNVSFWRHQSHTNTG